jgi:urea transport system permease protein
VKRAVLAFALWLSAALPTAPAAHAADLAPALSGLAANEFAATERAVEALAATGEPRARDVLQALLDGRLYRVKADGRLLVATSAVRDPELEPAEGGPSAGRLPAAELDKIRINNKLRNQLRAAVGRFGLTSPDPAVRQSSVDALIRERAADAVPVLEAALAAEKDAGIAGAMRFGLALLSLSGEDRARKLAAVETLGASLDPRARGVLGEAAASTDPEIAASAAVAIENIERRRLLLDLAVNLYQGISLGSILLLAGHRPRHHLRRDGRHQHGARRDDHAGRLRHLRRPAGVPRLAAALADRLVPRRGPARGGPARRHRGLLIERGVIRFLYGRPLETLLATWGLSLMLQQAVRSIFGPTNQEVANPAWMTGGVEIVGGVVLTYNRLVIIAFCLAVLAAGGAILRYSRFGLEMRAVTQNRRMAPRWASTPAGSTPSPSRWAPPSPAWAAWPFSQVGNVSPNLGTLYIIDSFLVVVFGGVGQLAGTLTGAMSLGVANKLLEPLAGAVLGKVLVLVLLILFIQRRPQGLFVLKGRSAEA